jgi:tetratricopeptide (TPR) repeat protein
LAVGGVYYQSKNYDMAIRFYDDAVSLKPDYSNALYNLAVALRDKGNFAEGGTIAEKLVAQLQDKPDSQDYKTAAALLSELKDKAASAANNQTPARESSSNPTS